MTRLAHLFSATAALLIVSGAMARAEDSNPPKAVIELFTSQGCSSCPPADALFVELAKQPGLIALTLPVTYWDYLGWKDTLGKDSFAKRQKVYAKARGDGQVYTPQAVINGAAHVVGSDRAEIERAGQNPPGTGFVARVSVKEEAGSLQVSLAPLNEPSTRQAGVWVLATTRLVTVPIVRGENQGKTVSYANVVRSMTRIGDWDGSKTVLTAPLAATQAPEADGYVVLVQADQPGKYGMMPGAILGAARSPR
ncbi:thioredoxin family protein [Bosea sp. (in: a-proteobacteria)]|uniref:DUF1223 domain-containing protein n=1 Tax=Bosea sp. (in: a-proteobacteria) TaxID=1871050 RepID=UPI0027343B0B|nr:DUF1223 domain-containing protein [Bosea sp. (in: a-proteobacteria)]MDP3410030.1 DUF1223 domain-containing protein [Bosea sp. (in: a-proteobacteria)]